MDPLRPLRASLRLTACCRVDFGNDPVPTGDCRVLGSGVGQLTAQNVSTESVIGTGTGVLP
jgi:hypothetical protein